MRRTWGLLAAGLLTLGLCGCVEPAPNTCTEHSQCDNGYACDKNDTQQCLPDCTDHACTGGHYCAKVDDEKSVCRLGAAPGDAGGD